jgi:hypothetical protein
MADAIVQLEELADRRETGRMRFALSLSIIPTKGQELARHGCAMVVTIRIGFAVQGLLVFEVADRPSRAPQYPSQKQPSQPKTGTAHCPGRRHEAVLPRTPDDVLIQIIIRVDLTILIVQTKNPRVYLKQPDIA